MGPERGRSTIDGGYELEAGSSASPPKNLRVFDYVAAAVLAADADAAVL